MEKKDERFEVDNMGRLVKGKPVLLGDKDLKEMIEKLFNRNGWSYKLLSEELASGAKIELKNSNLQKEHVLHFYYGKVRKEEDRRSPKEKRIQLGKKDPREHLDNGIILGFYVYEGPISIDNVILVAWPIDSNMNYPTNPSLRVNVEKDILPAKNTGFYVDKISGKNLVVFRPEFIYFYLERYKELHGGEQSQSYINSGELSQSHISLKPLTEYKTTFERNRIIFGAPGTGKSYKLKEDVEELFRPNGGTFERVTFYPDYSYSQFVGTYKPVSREEKIDYEFVEGPFLRVYIEAIKNPEQPHLLLIEEINRAKVASVFGDIFQLLDRDDSGISEYEIQTSEDIRRCLATRFNDDPDNWKKIKIPSNMFIWATMNSADQGVFHMDTAFKRRWNFEYCDIDENEDKIKDKMITLGSGDYELPVDWNKLRKAINEKLAKDYRVNEDKLMGPFFLSKDVIKTVNATDNTIADREKFIKAFKSKVIMYLYEDAAKQHKYKLFSGCDNTKYSSVCKAFDEIGIRIFGQDFEELYNRQEG